MVALTKHCLEVWQLVNIMLSYALEYYGEENLSNQPAVYGMLSALYNGTTDADKPLTDKMITMWTNFAKSG